MDPIPSILTWKILHPEDSVDQTGSSFPSRAHSDLCVPHSVVPPQPSRGRVRRERAERDLLRNGPRTCQSLQPQPDRGQRVARDLPHRPRRVGAVREVDQRGHHRLRVRQGDDAPGLGGQVEERSDRRVLLLDVASHGRRAQEGEHGTRGQADLGRRVRAQVLDRAHGPHPILCDLGPAAEEEGVHGPRVSGEVGVVGRESREVAQNLDAPGVEGAVEDARQEDDVLQQRVVPTERGGIRAVLREVGERGARAELALGEEVGRVLDVELLEGGDLHLDALLLLDAAVVVVHGGGVVVVGVRVHDGFLGEVLLSFHLLVDAVPLRVVRGLVREVVLGEGGPGAVGEGARARVRERASVLSGVEARPALAAAPAAPPGRSFAIVLSALFGRLLSLAVLGSASIAGSSSSSFFAVLPGGVLVAPPAPLLPLLPHHHEISQHRGQSLHASHPPPVPGGLGQRRQRRRGPPPRLPRVLLHHLHQDLEGARMPRDDEAVVLRLR
ncbi:hypothetical protein ACHAWF_014059 [Thalassiosira exigua]